MLVLALAAVRQPGLVAAAAVAVAVAGGASSAGAVLGCSRPDAELAAAVESPVPVPAPAVAVARPSSFAADSIVDASAAFRQQEVLPVASFAGTSPAAVHSSGSSLFS